ncbi:MAG: ribosome silencing factor [Puniceicoccales bacterium]|nr:ribosome silencing factor [Puniceicoccales bacterium]
MTTALTAPIKNSVRKNFPEALAMGCRIMAEKKCTDLRAFDLRSATGIADYIALATCTSEPHLRALSEELYQAFKRCGQLCRVDYRPMSGWMVFDAFDVILHAFTETAQKFYNLDALFKQSNILDLNRIFFLDIGEKSAICMGNYG